MDCYKKKLNSLIKYSVGTFQNSNDAHLNARKSAEALCKLMILKHYGEERGSNILYRQDREWNSRLKITKSQQEKSHPMVLNMLIQVCTSKAILRSCYQKEYQDKELSEVIRNTIIYLESILYALNSRGNSSAHESHHRPLYAETTQNLLREVLEWLFQDYLKIDIPHELVCYIGTYDIFISYKQEDEAWVEILKKNLLLHGYKLFIDNYELIAGENTKKSLRHAIKNSRNAIEVYPEKDDSVWIKNELEWIKEKKEEDNSFKSIPIVIHKSNNLPPENIKYTDFSSQEYKEAFNRLLCSLERVPPSSNYIKHELELPAVANQFVDGVIEHLDIEKMVILFSQEFSDIRRYYSSIKEHLQTKFSDHFYTLFIPSVEKEEQYFSFIAKSCEIEEKVENLQDWKTAMQKKLSRGEEILLLITDLESGKEECNQKLASALRNLSENSDNFYVVLVGHKELAKLVFQEVELSPLRSTGKRIFFPYANTEISYEELLLILSHRVIDEQKEYLLKILEKNKVQRFSPWSPNELINYLFWKGVLIHKNDYLVWRSEELHQIIKEMFEESTTI